MIDKILFASDFAQNSTSAEQHTLFVAKASSAKVTVIHAVEPIEGSGDDDAVARFLQRKRTMASKQAEVVAERLRAEGVETDVVVPVGKRWKAIIDHATEGKYDLVVIGAHSVKDGDKVYMGTTTQKVFFAADMPLLVIPV